MWKPVHGLERFFRVYVFVHPVINAGSKRDMHDATIMDGTTLFDKYFPNTFKVKMEHSIRMICYKIGIYNIVKNAYVRITHKY